MHYSCIDITKYLLLKQQKIRQTDSLSGQGLNKVKACRIKCVTNDVTRHYSCIDTTKYLFLKQQKKNQTASLIEKCRSGQGLNRMIISRIKCVTNDVIEICLIGLSFSKALLILYIV